MYLFLLEFTYASEDREIIETWLAQANLDGTLICTMQYDDEILSVLASKHTLIEEQQKILRLPAISSCEEKHHAVYHVTTKVAPELVLRAFPFDEDEEWYRESERTAYVCLQSHQFSSQQISWLAACTQIESWEYLFALSPAPCAPRPYQHL